MAAAYTWHSGSHALKAQWPVPTPILPDEILSSWLVRTALRQGCSPMTLAATIWPGWRMWTIDTDRSLSFDRLRILSMRSGIDPDAIRAATLHPTISKIQQNPLTNKATWPWALTIGARNVKRRSGLQYCPLCLAEDASPYFRLNWRFAWHTGCQRHQCTLLDRCWNCQSPIEPHRLTELAPNATTCPTCGELLADALTEGIDPYAAALQQATDQALVTGFFRQPIAEGTVFDWFQLLNFFVSLIRRSACTNTDTQSHLFQLLDIDVPDGFPLHSGTNTEWLPIASRQALLRTVWSFITVSQEDFKSKLIESGISKQGLTEDIDSVPPAIQDLLHQLPDAKRKPRKTATTRKPGPRPRREVERMMARLQRKLEMRQR
ncbi:MULTISPECIES: TniQ family protein [Marinobacter]|uniref:TniQ family protein n=1 Tax=Marinobacter TaxID=2742 RepID=UPI0017E76B33|nr:TniQ family protein [Marinobacter nauticus]HIB69711.1 hypothetical protein [Phycisphaerales bacterium]